jgi:glycosidase
MNRSIRWSRRGHIVLSSILLCTLTSAGIAQPRVPSWAKDAVWYQIFPERFRNGDPQNDPIASDLELRPGREWHISPWTDDWYRLQPWERAISSDFYRNVFERRYGGDLQGVLDKLEYLSSLGITAIYFNPVFESFSLHKYDASSYHHIDHTFGPDPRGDLQRMESETDDAATWHWNAADSLFLTLVREAHRRHIRVIIDGVFNHCGTRFFAFKDLVDHQQHSRYAEWFQVRRWDDTRTPYSEFSYKGWWDHPSMPQFNRDTNTLVKPVRDYFAGVTKRWMDPNGDGDPTDGVDGWRLDVANDVPAGFWREWRALVKSINPEALIVGEIWENAAEWLRGDQFDAVMNYRFAYACVQFFINTTTDHLSPSAFDAELAAIRNGYPSETNDILQNLLDSHDTDRLASMIANPNRRYDQSNGPRGNPQYDVSAPSRSARRTQRLMTLFQMTAVGAPMVYYGDEAGMWGADDPDDRKPMVWADLAYENERSHPIAGRTRADDVVRFDDEVFAWYRRLIGIRNAHESLRRGAHHTLTADDNANTYLFERATKTETIVVAINNGEGDQTVALPAGIRYANLLTGRIENGTIGLAGKSGAMLLKQ